MVEADCSGYALGACLSQFDSEGKLRPVAYYSRRLSGAEVNYPIHEKNAVNCFVPLGMASRVTVDLKTIHHFN